MGCDIHAGIEFFDGRKWNAVMFKNKWYTPKPLAIAGAADASSIATFAYMDDADDDDPEEKEYTPSLDLGRDYNLFAILGNVRNARGFAGIVTGAGYIPISDSRGLPDDISPEARKWACTGDHSDTWVGLQEILDYDWTYPAVSCGYVNAVEFEDWDRKKKWNPAPNGWCGDVAGERIRKISNEEMRRHVADVIGGARGQQFAEAIKKLDTNLYTRIEWSRSCAEEGIQIWTKILPVMLPLGKHYGYQNVRLVMNFDS